MHQILKFFDSFNDDYSKVAVFVRGVSIQQRAISSFDRLRPTIPQQEAADRSAPRPEQKLRDAPAAASARHKNLIYKTSFDCTEKAERTVECNGRVFCLEDEPGVYRVWDVISNEEVVETVSSTVDKAKSAKRLVDCTIRAWKRKKKRIATDDISAICVFFHNNSQIQHEATPK
ncbi:hypothetical protein L1987_78053 [Smallanthus sonchifolius]|uniref:Uncharacterized protein n=1 Tax=Smallanthus sonchifolius TaxID=185202 RepID=A0ACB8ZG21_9ASTR|nr:hypothetical protein L1987_78053 [Smallanthus sonchifolius]